MSGVFPTQVLAVSVEMDDVLHHSPVSRSHSYGPAKDVVCNAMGLTDEQLHHIVSGTAQELFGSWTDRA